MASQAKTTSTKRANKKIVTTRTRGKRSAAKLRKLKRSGALLVVG